MPAALEFTRPRSSEASRPPEARGLDRDGVRLLVSSSAGHEHVGFRDLPAYLPPGALLVVNRSAVLPASLSARGRVGELVVNASTHYGKGLWAVEPRRAFDTPGPLPLQRGEVIEVAGVPGRLVAPFPGLERLWFIRVAEDLRERMVQVGSPIRYGHLEPPFPPLAAYRTLFSSVPGSAEMPSAGRPFTPRVLAALVRKGVRLASVVLHAGVSSLEMEDGRVEDHPPLPEPFTVSARTARAVNRARARGRPVIAVGTSVVRALEAAGRNGRLEPRRGFTRRFVHPGDPARVVDGLLTGFHDPRSSHLALLLGLAPRSLVVDAYGQAVREGYLWHEFGDVHLILRRPLRKAVAFGAPL